MMALAAAGGVPVDVVCSSSCSSTSSSSSDHHGQQQQQAAGVGGVESPPASLLHLHHRGRSANYQPSTWDYDSVIGSSPAAVRATSSGPAANDPADELQVNKDKDRVRRLLQQLLLQRQEQQPQATTTMIRLIHQLQSFGVAYHFEEEIRGILLAMHRANDKLDLHSSALLFGMLRGHGIAASTDMLMTSACGTRNSNKKVVVDDSSDDALLALYQASYLAFPGETLLEEARAFAVDNLLLEADDDDCSHLPPLHWRVPRLQAMWSLSRKAARRRGGGGDEDDEEHTMSTAAAIDSAMILRLAQADFNLVQALHRAELAEVTRWWKQSGLGEKLPFARDRVVECFFCAACIAPEPRLAECRQVLAKTGSLIVHLDDVYDVYGTPDELQAFTDGIARWPDCDDDVVLAALPEYMRAMYSAIWTTSVHAADGVLKKQGCDVLPLYKRAWHELCMAFLVESQWQRRGYMPSFGEYVSNGWITSTGPLLLLHALPAAAPAIAEGHQLMMLLPSSSSSIDYPRLVELSSTIFRLCNDCAERGDAPSSIACCMAELRGTEEQARAAVQGVIAETWKVLNKEVVASAAAGGSWSMAMADLCLNLARTIHCIYQDGDGITSPTQRMNNVIKAMLFDPIVLTAA
ncbi:hypothetical protein BS78_02G001200 [Paspalum vaginatum]|nr:hypothetical protein BS78_02G001200 [Paspalum vaginatum]